jgi:hypothetical protein
MRDPYISQECKARHYSRADFTHNGWTCWRNMFGDWGAILSRKGLQPVIITGCATREELLEAINSPAHEPSKSTG